MLSSSYWFCLKMCSNWTKVLKLLQEVLLTAYGEDGTLGSKVSPPLVCFEADC